MYFEIEDLRPDTPRLDTGFSRRESVVYSVAAHVLFVLALFYVPQLPWIRDMAEEARRAAEEQQRLLEQRQRENAQFVFVQPRLDMTAPKPPPRAELSDQDRVAQSRERPPNPSNPLPYARGNSSERVEAEDMQKPRGEGPGQQPTPAAESTADGSGTNAETPPVQDNARLAYARPDAAPKPPTTPGGALGEALQNLQRYVQSESFDNPQGGGGAFGPSIQFDTKGVEFGPWIRRFIAQIKRNWFIPYAAMSFRGNVVVTFNVHKDGTISDLNVMRPSSVDAFNASAFNALVASNPTQPLPTEYPADKAFFTVTFYYNENPPSQ